MGILDSMPSGPEIELKKVNKKLTTVIQILEEIRDQKPIYTPTQRSFQGGQEEK